MPKQRHSRGRQGKVLLVGAGPGDPGLITWRGVECLRRADTVIYDYLANPALLTHAPPHARRICLGRHGRDRIWKQSEINAQLVKLAGQGQCVVRLKGGDPAIFARLAEEIDALESAGIEYEVVPGITAALAVGSYAGIWLTRREVASAVALVTGHEGNSQHAPDLDYRALAAFPGTLVFYMGVTTAGQWTAALIDAGKPPDTPAAIVRRCSWPDQAVIHCTLATLADELRRHRMRPPAVMIVGPVAGLADSSSWFMRRPLAGRTIVVTRPAERVDSLVGPLTELGADCLVQPAIKVSPPDDWEPVDAAIARLGDFHWIAFSSVNGVQYFLDRMLKHCGDIRRLAGIKLAAIGPGTAEELARYHLAVEGQPTGAYRAEALADVLSPEAAGKRFLLVRASRGREVLSERLRAAGAEVEQVVAYRSDDVHRPDENIANAMSEGKVDWITATSSAIACSLARMFADELNRTKIVSISPITSGTLRELGFEPAAEATTYTMSGVVEAILEAEGITEA